MIKPFGKSFGIMPWASGWSQVGSQTHLRRHAEKHLVGGALKVSPGPALVYGQSITDGCNAFDDIVPVLEEFAQAARTRHSRKVAD